MILRIRIRGARSRMFPDSGTHSSDCRSSRVDCQKVSLLLLLANEGPKNLL